MLTPITNNGLTVFIDDRAHDLNERRRELENVAEYDSEIYPDLLEALADDYESIGYRINAERLRKKAAHYRGTL